MLGIEDELFGGGHLGVGHDDGLVAGRGPALRGYSTLLAALERGRTGTLGDIVATIQAEQDEIIRSPQAGVLVVQGGPGTGKTVVALHRAAYLLYTHRFPLEDQGVLVIGPNRVFLRYIERVLPSLGEAGVEQVVLADLVPDVRWARPGDQGDSELAARVKGDARMSAVIDKAVADRERPLRDDLRVPFRTGFVRLTVGRLGTHRQGRPATLPAPQRRPAVRRERGVRRAGRVLAGRAGHRQRRAPGPPRAARRPRRPGADVAGRSRPPSCSTTCSARRLCCASPPAARSTEAEIDALHRPRAERRRTTSAGPPADVALLDDAREVLGPARRQGRQGRRRRRDPHVRAHRRRRGPGPHADAAEDGGPPLAQRLAHRGRRPRPGDGRAGARQLGRRPRPPARAQAGTRRRAVGRLPHPGPDHGARRSGDARRDAAAALAARRAGRRRPPEHRAGAERRRARCGGGRGDREDDRRADERQRRRDRARRPRRGDLRSRSTAAGIEHGRATRTGLDDPVTVVPVSVVKGLELDGVVVVEPARIVSDEVQGLRALYVA